MNIQKKLLRSAHSYGYEEGEEVGIKRGEKQANVEVAKKLLAKMSI